jgi:hypothetical protein
VKTNVSYDLSSKQPGFTKSSELPRKSQEPKQHRVKFDQF